MRVLIADTDPVSRDTVRAAAERAGHDCASAENAPRLWELEASLDPDVVVADLAMPGLDPLELALRLREAEHDRYTYVILVVDAAGDGSDFAELGGVADDHLTRPVDPAQLSHRLATASRVLHLHRRLADREAELDELTRRIAVEMRRDPLTGVANRARFCEDIDLLRERARRYGFPYCVGICDIDHFRAYNEHSGYRAGDELLTSVARTAAEKIRTADAVYRYGADELVVVLSEQPLGDATVAVERLRSAVERLAVPHPALGGHGLVTISAGVAGTSGRSSETLDALLDRAEAALRRAKEGGGNAVVEGRSDASSALERLEPQSPAAPTGAGPGARVRVLVADDDRVARLTLKAMIDSDPSLELVGVAEDAERAIGLAAEQRPDIAVLDVTMPAGGGARATRQIRASCADTRVMALSAHDDRETVVEMFRAGAVGYLVKGAPPSELLATIRRTAMGEPSLSPEILGEVVTELSDHLGREERESAGRQERTDRIRGVLDRGLLRMAFQPITALANGDLVGFEALARFPGDPPRPPDQWFAEAAELGLQVELEVAAIRVALASLPALPAGVALWVNVSPSVVTSASFGPALAAAPADRIVLEVTEHAPVDDYAALGSALRRLRSRGLRLAIDDAGAGFASLQHIVRLAPDGIKLDRTLTSHIETDRARRALTSALISFASETDATIVAEGIERRSEVEALRALGVTYGQGYFLGRPGALETPNPPAIPTDGLRSS